MKFIFACGGTAGHINPALAVASRLREAVPDAEILFIGAQGMMETELVPREGYPISTVEISNLSRSLSFAGLKHNLHTAKTVLTATRAAKAIIREFAPNAVIGTGGYVCYPALRAAHELGIPTLVHESNAVPGLTTKMLAGMVDCVMVGFAHVAGNYPKRARVEYTGTPVRTEFSALTQAEAKEKLGVPADKPLLLSVWGSLGSGHINAMMPEFAALCCEKGEFTLLHSAGRRGYAQLAERMAERDLADAADRGAEIREYIYDMGTAMTAADLVMCRSGAATLSELQLLGRPALLVPSPNVTNHQQERNAEALAASGAARVLREGEFDAAGLYAAAAALLRDKETLAQMALDMRDGGVPDAAERIASLVLGFVK